MLFRSPSVGDAVAADLSAAQGSLGAIVEALVASPDSVALGAAKTEISHLVEIWDARII